MAILTKTKVFEKYIKKSTLPTFMTFGKTKRANFILSIWKEKFKMSFSPCDLTHLAWGLFCLKLNNKQKLFKKLDILKELFDLCNLKFVFEDFLIKTSIVYTFKGTLERFNFPQLLVISSKGFKILFHNQSIFNQILLWRYFFPS